MRKRSRACEECHRLKIKCDVDASLTAACERCHRNSLQCVPAAPRLQRDRIAELEAQVQGLQAELHELRSAMTTPGAATTGRSPGSVPESAHPDVVLRFLDARIPLNSQQDLLSVFDQQAGAAWPFFRLQSGLDRLRRQCPVLLLTVLAYTVTQETQGTQQAVHDELVREAMRALGDEVLGRGQRSLEIVQALLVACFWNKFTRGHDQGSCYQLAQLALDMAIDLGIAGPSLQPSPVAYFSRHENPCALEARRTWLACYVASAASAISMRRPTTMPWNAHHQECVDELERNGDIRDPLLCQIVLITRLIQEISEELSLCRVTVFVDSNDVSTHVLMESLRTRVDLWASQVPASLVSSSTLIVWRHVAMIHIYEPVMHTPTNKALFGAPFIPGRIPVSDFPKPSVILPHVNVALQALVQHCHGVIETASGMEPLLAVSLPSFCFAPVVVYSLFVLVSVLVSATDPSNTYGRCIDKDCFRIEQCALKLRELTARAKSLDPSISSYTTRIIDATSWLEMWYLDYKAIVDRYETART